MLETLLRKPPPVQGQIAEPSSTLLTRRDYALAAAVTAALAAIVAVSQVIEAPPAVHSIAQFVHLACVVIGLGAVVVVDWFGLRWQFGQISFRAAVTTASALAAPIWFGLSGLLVSGMILRPDLSGSATWIKLSAVAGAGLGGVLALALSRQLSVHHRTPPVRLLRTAFGVAVSSQICWWTATVIGFLNRT